MNVKFSLLLATLNRSKEIKFCIESIFNQSYQDFEIIIVDQSDNDETEDYIKSLHKSNITYKHVNFKGLSKSRNYALQYVNGDYICLIDDDAYYDPFFLDNALKNLDDRMILSGYIYNTITNKEYVAYNNKKNEKILSLRMVIRTCPSAALVIPFKMINDVGGFDEEFGVGAKYGAGEETDLLIRGIKAGYCVKYVSNLKLKHPFPIPESSEYSLIEANRKREKYLAGFGALYKKLIVYEKVINVTPVFFEVLLKLIMKVILAIGNERRYKIDQYNSFINSFKNYKNR